MGGVLCVQCIQWIKLFHSWIKNSNLILSQKKNFWYLYSWLLQLGTEWVLTQSFGTLLKQNHQFDLDSIKCALAKWLKYSLVICKVSGSKPYRANQNKSRANSYHSKLRRKRIMPQLKQIARICKMKQTKSEKNWMEFTKSWKKMNKNQKGKSNSWNNWRKSWNT